MSDKETIRQAAGELSRLRGRPCLVLNTSLSPKAAKATRDVLRGHSGDLDVILRSPGGCICCAYAIARDLHRCSRQLGVFVPLQAKSAATVIAIAAHELVLSDRGEIGPLDAQFSDKQSADFPVDRSRLDLLRALDLLRKHALQTFDELVRSVTTNSGMRADDVCRIGAEFAARVCQPLYAQMDPRSLGASLRENENGAAYAERVLRRYRPELYAANGPQIVDRLVNGYPSHGFVIDREELEELGVPARAPTADEAPLLGHLADALESLDDTDTVIELIRPDDGVTSETRGDRNAWRDEAQPARAA
jgi:hypothetical protein